MKKIKKINTPFILFFLIIIPFAFGAVEPPNYDFSLDKLKVFFPGQKRTEIPSQYGNGVKVEEKGGLILYRYKIEHVRYIFPVFVQVKDDVIQDFFTNLPTYFLHDLFHQSLINRFGKQDLYQRVERQAAYIWNNKNNIKLTYSAGCAIGCFPVYLAGEFANLPDQMTTLKKMKDNLKIMNGP